jgi:hypothetical protein
MDTIIYQKPSTSDRTVILGTRSALNRPMNLVNSSGQPWTEVRLGMFFSIISSTSDNASPVAEELTQVPGSHTNRVTIGLKDSSQIFPGNPGSSFIGIMTSGSATHNSYAGSYPLYNWEAYGAASGNANQRCIGIGIHGTASFEGTAQQISFKSSSNPAGTILYGGAYGVKINILNRGASNQSVVISGSTHQPYNGGYTTAELQSWLTTPNNGWTGMGAFPWNDGVSARAIPDSFYLYSPFNLSRFRVSVLGAWVHA